MFQVLLTQEAKEIQGNKTHVHAFTPVQVCVHDMSVGAHVSRCVCVRLSHVNVCMCVCTCVCT
jgi:hypothetical protein